MLYRETNTRGLCYLLRFCFLLYHIDKSEYQKYYGDDGNDPSYPKYNVTQVLTSPAALAIASISTLELNADKVMKIRKKATIVYGKFTDFANCTNQTCLFDINKDPCETTDLASKYPEVRIVYLKYDDNTY